MKYIIVSIFSLLIFSCTSEKTSSGKEKSVFKVQATTLHSALFFTGTIQPLMESTISSPMDAVVESMPHLYGQYIKKGELVFTLNSSDLQKQYNETVTEYLKAKDTYTTAKSRFIGTEDLWNSGLIAKNNYLSEKSTLNTSKIALMQARERLTNLLEKVGEDNYSDISTLSFSDFNKVKSILGSKHNLVQIKANTNGVILHPPKNTEEKSNVLGIGSAVKSGQVLALIGNLNGIRVEIDIPEVDIDKVRTGTKAIVRSGALPREALIGEVVAINAQASTSSGGGGGLPSFSAIVEVKNLKKEQQEWIKVGMSTNIELDIEHKNKLLIPISAVRQESGQSIVQLLQKDGDSIKQIITTGPTQADKVVVNSGLKENDEVIYG